MKVWVVWDNGRNEEPFVYSVWDNKESARKEAKEYNCMFQEMELSGKE